MNAIIYSRVSTDSQDNQRQIDELRDYAKYKKYDVIKVFEEKISGVTKSSKREEFAKMLKYIESNKVDHLLIWEISRLGRGGVADVATIVEKFTDKGINIYFKKEELNTIKNGKKDSYTDMIIAVFSAVASMERETFTARSISGIRANVARGGIGTGGVKPYGYKSEKGMLVVDQEEAKVVKEIYEKYTNGLGTQQIANYLNNQGVKTRYNKEYKGKELTTRFGLKKKAEDYVWRDATVYSILTNSIYVTGDASGKNNSTRTADGVNDYTAIFEELKPYVGVKDYVPSKNPNVFQRGEYINAIFNHDVEGVCVQVHESCENLIQDLINVKRAEDGSKLKRRIKDKATGQSMEEFGHMSDALDLMTCQFLKEDFKKYLKGGELLISVGNAFVSSNLF